METLIEFLRKLPDKDFDYRHVIHLKEFSTDEASVLAEMKAAVKSGNLHSCGSTGCAIGWAMAILPESVITTSPKTYQAYNPRLDVKVTSCFGDTKRLSSTDYTDIGSALFNISLEASHFLFTPTMNEIQFWSADEDLEKYRRIFEDETDIFVFNQSATAKAVAYRLEEFLKTGSVLMSLEKGFKIP